MMLDKESSRRLPPCSGFICGPFNDGSNAIEVMGCVVLSGEGTAGRPSKASFWHNLIGGCSDTPTLEQLRERFSPRVECSTVTIHNTLKRLDYRFKKSRYERVSKTDTT
jgi:hypothetical protein